MLYVFFIRHLRRQRQNRGFAYLSFRLERVFLDQFVLWLVRSVLFLLLCSRKKLKNLFFNFVKLCSYIFGCKPYRTTTISTKDKIASTGFFIRSLTWSDSFWRTNYSKFVCLDNLEAYSSSGYDKTETLSCIIVSYLYFVTQQKHLGLRYVVNIWSPKALKISCSINLKQKKKALLCHTSKPWDGVNETNVRTAHRRCS